MYVRKHYKKWQAVVRRKGIKTITKSFDLMPQPILIESSCWIGAKSLIFPGTHLKKGSVIKMGSNCK